MIGTITGDKNQVIRRKAILELLDADGTLSVNELSERFNVSSVTIRKDLENLQNSGLVVRKHGRAVKVNADNSKPDYEARMNINSEKKRRIAKAALQLIDEGDSIIMNVGSTSAYLCEELKNKNDITVVTNAVTLAKTLLNYENVTTFLLGGRVDRNMQIAVGEDTLEQLMKYNVNKLFMGMDGVDVKAGATSYNHREDSIMHQMIAQSKEKYLIVDDSKFGRAALVHVADLSDFDAIITNYEARNEKCYADIRALGVRVITV